MAFVTHRLGDTIQKTTYYPFGHVWWTRTTVKDSE